MSQVGRSVGRSHDASLTGRINYDINVDLSQSVRGGQCMSLDSTENSVKSTMDRFPGLTVVVGARPETRPGGGSVHWRANGRHIVLKAQVSTYTCICIYTCQLSANID